MRPTKKRGHWLLHDRGNVRTRIWDIHKSGIDLQCQRPPMCLWIFFCLNGQLFVI